MVRFLVRQKPFWAAIGLAAVFIAGYTYYAIHYKPFMVENLDGIGLEGLQPTARPMGETPKAVERVDLPGIPESVQESKSEAAALLRMAETHFQQGLWDEAVDELKRAVGLTSDTSVLSIAYANLAYLMDSEGKYSEAEKFLQRAVAFDKKFIQAYHNLGVIYLHLHDYDKALLAFQLAVREQADFSPSLAGIGEVHATMARYPEAITTFTESLRLREDPSVRYNLALAYLHSGNRSKAGAEFTTVLNTTPDPYMKYLALFNRAIAFDQERRYDEAAADYRAALTMTPTDIEARYNLGLMLKEGGKKEEALKEFLEVIKLDKDNIDAYYNAVTILAELGQYQQAMDLLKPVHDRLPDNKRINYLMGHLHHRLGNLPASHESFNTIVGYSGREDIPIQLKADAMAGLAAVMDDSGDIKFAEHLYKDALDLGDASYLRYNLARTLKRGRKYEESAKQATTAVEQEPGNYTYRLALAEVLLEGQNLTKAFDVYKQAAELAPQEYYPRFMMAYTAGRQRLWHTALTEYNRLLGSDLTPAIRGAVHKGIGNIYHDQGDFTEALKSYKEALPLVPTDADLFYNVSRTYFQMSRLDESFAALQKCIALNPVSSEAYTLLGVYYFKKGLLPKAREAFDKAIQINPENLEAYYNRDVLIKQL